MSFSLAAGETLAVIGANGSGKSLLLKSILGVHPLSGGQALFRGQPLDHGIHQIGYIPQHRGQDHDLPLRARDLVRFGLDGHRYGFPWGPRSTRDKVERALAEVGVSQLAERRIGLLSGGELQRVRVAQALVGKPNLLLADEPLSALDLRHQSLVSQLIQQRCEQEGMAAIFVTHDLNPVINQITRVLYLAPGGHRIGSLDEVMRSDVLTELYGSPVEVLRSEGRLVVVGGAGTAHHDHDHWGEH